MYGMTVIIMNLKLIGDIAFDLFSKLNCEVSNRTWLVCTFRSDQSASNCIGKFNNVAQLFSLLMQPLKSTYELWTQVISILPSHYKYHFFFFRRKQSFKSLKRELKSYQLPNFTVNITSFKRQKCRNSCATMVEWL